MEQNVESFLCTERTLLYASLPLAFCLLASRGTQDCRAALWDSAQDTPWEQEHGPIAVRWPSGELAL